MRFFKATIGVFSLVLLFSSCSEDEPTQETTSFRITLTNAINLLSTHIFNTPVGESAPAPIANQGGQYAITFKASVGSKLNFASMLANSNDWFFAADPDGIDLFGTDGMPMTGDITDNIRLYDAGTEEEDPTTIATVPDGATMGAPDDNTNVRTQQQDISNYLMANLTYNNGEFTLTLTKQQDGILTPGIVVVYAADNPIFTMGEADRGQGLKALAEAGNPQELYDYYNMMGSNGAPLRLSASHTPFSPAVVYAFDADSDPLFTQGEAVKAGSGLEELAEDGNNQLIFDYLKGLGLPAAQSNEAGGIGPNGSLTFDIDVPQGYKLGLAAMFVQSNDWFVAFNNAGVALFDAAGRPISGTDASTQLYLYDAGTEADETVGMGMNQPMRQAATNTGDADANTATRRVTSIMDMQFGKGAITSMPGVVYLQDARGGYNLLKLEITVN